MNVRKEDSPVDPSYPDAKEFMKHKAAISAAILGAGMAVGGCQPTPRLGGSIAVPPGGSKESWVEDPSSWKGGEKPKVEKTTEHDVDVPRVPGKARIEPPRLPGAPPMNPDPAAP